MRFRLSPLLIPFTVTALLSAGSFAAASPWLLRIHSLSFNDGRIVIETSPSGRLADPYRDEHSISLPTAAIAIGTGLAAFILLDLLISIPFMAACSDRSQK